MSTEKIRALNDAFRTTMTGGRVVMTAGVDALSSDVKAMVIRRVATFADFTPENDPHGEHDFGNFECRRKIEMTPGAQSRDDTPGWRRARRARPELHRSSESRAADLIASLDQD
jgi:Protein of unknown function (DUF3768)